MVAGMQPLVAAFWGAFFGTLTGMIGLYVMLATWGPKLAPQLAALPGGRTPPAR